MLIESDKERAKFIANGLSRTVVLRGDALDKEILRGQRKDYKQSRSCYLR